MTTREPPHATAPGGFVRGLTRALQAVAMAALVVLTLWTVTDVATRYFLSRPLTGSIDLVESMLVLVVFLALPECFRRGEQITVDVIDHVVGPRTVRRLEGFGVLCTLVFLGLLAWTGIQPCLDALRFGDHKPDLPIPIFALLAAVEVALCASIVAVIARLVASRRVRGDETGP